MQFLQKSAIFSIFALFAFATAATADPILTFQGTGSDADLSFQFVSPATLDTPGLLTTFSFNTCNAQPGESCDQVNFSAVSGVIRFVGIVTSGLDVRTFEFDSFVNNGTYSTLAVGSPNSGTLEVTGSTDAVPEPSSLAFAALGVFLVAVRVIGGRRQKPLASETI
jgi:PEP-CTERM motif-containing protein